MLILRNTQPELTDSIERFLTQMAHQPAYAKLINDGLGLIRLKSFLTV